MTGIRRPAPNPCVSCPYRRDAPQGLWADSEYVKLPRYDAVTADQPPGVFQCHQTERGDPGVRVCAGWAAVHGAQPHDRALLALRLAEALGTMDPDELAATEAYRTRVPVWESGAQAALHGMGAMSPQARRMARKVMARRTDVLIGDDDGPEDDSDNLVWPEDHPCQCGCAQADHLDHRHRCTGCRDCTAYRPEEDM